MRNSIICRMRAVGTDPDRCFKLAIERSVSNSFGVSFHELWCLSNVICDMLSEFDSASSICPHVGIQMDVSEISIASIWACILKGWIFVPIDIGHVALSSSEVVPLNVVLTQSVASVWTCPTLSVEYESSRRTLKWHSSSSCRSGERPITDFTSARWDTNTDLMYLYLTSGSTGVPKRIYGHYSGFFHRLEWSRSLTPIAPSSSDVGCLVTQLTFIDALMQVCSTASFVCDLRLSVLARFLNPSSLVPRSS